MEKQKDRLAFFKRLLGDKGGVEADNALNKLAQALDTAGVQSKAVRLKGVMENMKADFEKVCSKYMDSPTPELISELIATALNSMMPNSDDPLDEEMMADEEIADDEALEAQEMMGNPYGEEMSKSLRTTKEQLANVAKDVREQNELIAELMPLLAGVATTLANVQNDVNGLKSKINAQPKRVGQGDGGIVDDPNVKRKMENGNAIVDNFWGQQLPITGGKK